ncbi:MAG: sterol desaturase family protein [Flavobacteriales bacterium]|nr:sterol desaturase family protein [Flavobacteriales bacterium]MCB9192027.1 sterol desaturase family protein [Flavobacteriales bacterium]MCB9204081.1 sterol desaturase family protein [Flavobacteriales bacterium]
MKVSYIALSIPVFFLLIGIELLVGYLKKEKLYRFNDALTNINLGTGQQIVGVMMKGLFFLGYLYLYEHRVYTFENTWFTWILLFLGVDFFYYWFHRMSHEVNALWAAHIVHHQSEDYNLSVALRQSWFQGWFSWAFYLPLAVVGFDPIMFAAMNSFNTLYQFWIHTTTIKTLGPLEWIFNTPSHHRVHHGSNPKYIDKNHAGSLIIWDRLFGTFQKEEEEVVYGITKPLNSWNPIWANFHYWKELIDLAKQSKGFDKVLVFLKPPGWQPEYLGGFQAPQEIDKTTYRKYDFDGMSHQHIYVFFIFLLALALATIVLFLKASIPSIALYATMFYILLTLGINGGLMEKRNWLIQAEYGRIIAGLLVALLYWEMPQFDLILRGTAVFTLINLIWFNRIVKQIRSEQ